MRPLGAAALLAAAGTTLTAALCEGGFLHGVASGDPTPEAIVLWTRVTPSNATDASPQPVRWSVWPEGAGASAAVASGEALALLEHDFTVKVDVHSQLQPRVRYTFGFECGAARSPEGSFHLPPPGNETLGELKFGVFSCADWQSGLFTAYRAASREPLDFWLHLGDFIYEYKEEADASVVRMGLQPPHEVVSLDDYRRRFAHYRRDADLQSLSAKAPVIPIWDDHELANDVWMHGAKNHQPATEGNFTERKVASIRAYHEWMPTRASGAGRSPWNRWRRFDFGDLASLLLLETRHSGRTNNAEVTRSKISDAIEELIRAAGVPPLRDWNGSSLERQLLALQARTEAHRHRDKKEILGQEQFQWLEEQALNVAERGATWRLVAQSVVMQDKKSPDFAGAVRRAAALGRTAEAGRWDSLLKNLTQGVGTVTVGGSLLPVTPALQVKALAQYAAGRYGFTKNHDSWQGYAAARERLLNALARGKPVSTVVYGGDSHNAWAGTLVDASGRAVAAEFDGMSVSSFGLEDYVPFVPPDLMAAGWRISNSNLRWTDTSRRGYMLVHLNKTMQHVQYLAVRTDKKATDSTERLAEFAAEPAAAAHCPRVSWGSQESSPTVLAQVRAARSASFLRLVRKWR